MLIDLELSGINKISRGPQGNLFRTNEQSGGLDDASSNFARGYYTLGRKYIEEITNEIRSLGERCDNLDGIFLTHAVAGGTGGGLTSLILERLKLIILKPMVTTGVFPSENVCNEILEPYNGALSIQCLMDYADVSMLVDNEALARQAKKSAKIRKPNYKELNQIYSLALAPVTHPFRFPKTFPEP
eukprot:UN32698